MKRLAIALLLFGALLLAAAAWIREVSLTGTRKDLVESLLARVLETPVHFGTLRLSLSPARLDADDVSLGDPGVVEIGSLHLQVLALASLREGRPVLIAKVEAPMIDLTQIPDDGEDSEGPPDDLVSGLPPLRLSELEITNFHLRFRMGLDPVDVLAESIQGSMQRGVLRGAVELSLSAVAAEWHRKQFLFRIDRLNAAGGADADGVWFERFAADGPDIRLEVAASKASHRQEVVGDFNPQLLGAFVDELGEIGGKAHVQGILAGSVIDPIVDVQLEIAGGSLAGRPVGDLSTRFTRKRSRLAFEGLRVKGEVGEAFGSVELVAYHEVPLQADLRWEHLNLQALLHVVGTELPFHNFLDGQTVLTGTLDPLDLHIRGSGTGQPLESERAADVAAWTAATRIRDDHFEANARITQKARSRNEGEGGNEVTARLSIAGDEFRGRLDATLADLDALSGFLPQPLPQLAAEGGGELWVDLAGTVSEPTMHGALHLTRASFSGTPVDDLQAILSLSGGHISTPNLTFTAGGGEGSLRGVVAINSTAVNDWKLSLRDVDGDLLTSLAAKLGAVEIPIRRGTLSGNVSGSGTWPLARLVADVSARSFELLDEPFEAAQLNLVATLPVWEAQLRLDHHAGESIRAKGRGKSPAEGDLSFDSDPIRLGGIGLLHRPDLRGVAQLQGQLGGRWQSLSGRAGLSAKQVAIDQHRLGDIDLRALADAGNWRFQASGLDGRLVAAATLRTQTPFPYTLAVQLDDSDLTELVLSSAASSQLRVAATMEVAGTLTDLYRPKGSLRVTDLHLQRNPHVVEESEPLVFDLEGGSLRIRSCKLQSAGSRLSLSGSLGFDGTTDLDVQGGGDLVVLELLDLPLAAARGPFSIRATVRYRSDSGWILGGEGAVQDAVLDFGLPVAFTRTNGTFRLRDNQIVIERLEARAGGGRFELGGHIDLRSGPQLVWAADQVGFSPGDGLDLKVTGNGKLGGSWERPLLSGSIEVPSGLYDENFDWKDLLPWLLEQLAGRALPRVRSTDQVIALDLVVYSRGGVFVDNNLANLEMWLDLQILGDTRTPVISGRIGFLDGEVFLRGRKFTIAGGTVDFRDYYRNDPIINITAEGRVTSTDNDYGLSLIISGSASNPRIRFSASDPTLSQTDVLSLATFGKTGAELQREGGGVSAADALALVPTGEIEKRVGQLVGFDRFQIEAVQSRNSGAIEPRVTIGKDITENLRALAWTSFGLEARRAVQLEYRVTRRVSLLGAWESDATSQAGAFGGDLKFRYEFRKVPFSLLNEFREQLW